MVFLLKQKRIILDGNWKHASLFLPSPPPPPPRPPLAPPPPLLLRPSPDLQDGLPRLGPLRHRRRHRRTSRRQAVQLGARREKVGGAFELRYHPEYFCFDKHAQQKREIHDMMDCFLIFSPRCSHALTFTGLPLEYVFSALTLSFVLVPGAAAALQSVALGRADRALDFGEGPQVKLRWKWLWIVSVPFYVVAMAAWWPFVPMIRFCTWQKRNRIPKYIVASLSQIFLSAAALVPRNDGPGPLRPPVPRLRERLPPIGGPWRDRSPARAAGQHGPAGVAADAVRRVPKGDIPQGSSHLCRRVFDSISASEAAKTQQPQVKLVAET